MRGRRPKTYAEPYPESAELSSGFFDSEEIHPSAIIHKNTIIGKDVSIGPYSIIGDGVRIGDRTKIGPHVVIYGPTEIGDDCIFYQFSAIGGLPQDLKYKGDDTKIRIGNRNIFREFVTIHRASSYGTGETVIGDDNYLMAYVHIAHDCRLGNSIIMSNSATLGGHIEIEDYAIVGGLSAIHQFTRIGVYAMVGGCSAIVQDVPPYTTAVGNRAKLYGLNLIGLRRHGFSENTISTLKKAYKIIFQSKLTLKVAIKRVREEIKGSMEVDHLLRFIEKSERGICR
ncbi:MAG: acyl-ACP--UDP-N-acetylglucosamine O-acyltransferase [Nitrospirota bacterium]